MTQLARWSLGTVDKQRADFLARCEHEGLSEDDVLLLDQEGFTRTDLFPRDELVCKQAGSRPSFCLSVCVSVSVSLLSRALAR